MTGSYSKLTENLNKKEISFLAAQDLSNQALSFLSTGLPTRKDEDWRYTNIQGLAQEGLIESNAKDLSSLEKNEELLQELGKFKNEIVLLNGCFNSKLSKYEGCEVSILSNGLSKENEKAFDQQICKIHLEEDRANFIKNMSWAYFSEVIVLKVPTGTSPDSPLRIVHINLNDQTATQYISSKLIVVLESESKLELIEESIGLKGPSFSNLTTDIELKNNSKLCYFKNQKETEVSHHFHHITVLQDKNSRSEIFQLSTGADIYKNYVNVQQNEEQAESIISGFYYAQGDQKQDHQVLASHDKPYGMSRQLYKGILDDRSRVVFNGKIYIAEDAQKVNSAQLNQSITLSSQAEVDTKPELEILADDVSAQHGATIGELDLSQVFYLMSRGISKKEAISLLIQGFALETLEGIDSSQNIKSYIEVQLSELMKSLEGNLISGGKA